MTTIAEVWRPAPDSSLYWPRNMAQRLTMRARDYAPLKPKEARERALNIERCALWILLQKTQDEDALYHKWLADCGLEGAE